MTLGILLSTPYAFEYDLTLLGLALAWLSWEGHTQGWLPLEPLILCVGWIMPLDVATLAKISGVQVGPVVLLALLVLALRRAAFPPPLETEVEPMKGC